MAVVLNGHQSSTMDDFSSTCGIVLRVVSELSATVVGVCATVHGDSGPGDIGEIGEKPEDVTVGTGEVLPVTLDVAELPSLREACLLRDIFLIMPGSNSGWRRACLFRWSERMKRFSQIGQTNLFSPAKYKSTVLVKLPWINCLKWVRRENKEPLSLCLGYC